MRFTMALDPVTHTIVRLGRCTRFRVPFTPVGVLDCIAWCMEAQRRSYLSESLNRSSGDKGEASTCREFVVAFLKIGDSLFQPWCLEIGEPYCHEKSCVHQRVSNRKRPYNRAPVQRVQLDYSLCYAKPKCETAMTICTSNESPSVSGTEEVTHLQSYLFLWLSFPVHPIHGRTHASTLVPASTRAYRHFLLARIQHSSPEIRSENINIPGRLCLLPWNEFLPDTKTSINPQFL